MKIILMTCGSRGDVQPMAAICLALQKEGHQVTLIGPPDKAQWAEDEGCTYIPFGWDVTEFIEQVDNVHHVSNAFKFMAFVRRSCKLQLSRLPGLIKGTDIVAASSLMFGASTAAQQLGIPYRYIVFSTQLLPSQHHPFPIFSSQSWPLWMNSLSWKLADTIDLFNFTHLLNRHRKQIGLNMVHNAWDHILGDRPIAACDPQIVGIPEDVKKTVVQTGYPHLPVKGHLPKQLQRFIEEGTRPVFAGFGSMPSGDQKKQIRLLVETAGHLNRRIIILAPWQKNPAEQPEKDVFFIRHVPHALLFPAMSAIIHHGGAGTTAVSAMSGVPQIIVPHILDQYYHGYRIYQSGLGPCPVPRSRLTSRALIRAVEKALHDPGIKRQAAAAGQRIDPDLSLQRAVQAVTAL